MVVNLMIGRIDRRGFLRGLSATAVGVAGVSALQAQEPGDDAIVPIGRRMAALEEAAALSMQFRGESAEAARRWQVEFRAKLCELLGPTDRPASWESVLERRVELPTHVREERLLRGEGFAPVPFHLLLPREEATAAARPAILALHGHGEFGHDSVAGIDDTPQRKAAIAESKYDYGVKLVERGYVVAAPCLTPFGRRLGTKKVNRGDPCTLVNLQFQHLGKLLIAENLRDCLWTLDALARDDRVDAERIGCVGLSYGGRMTTLTAALDERVRVAVVAGAMNMLQERAMNGATAGCQVIPGLLNYGDMPEVAGLIAPRPCVWTVGDRDGLMKPEWVDKFHERLGRLYRVLDAADQLHVDRFAGGHEWHGDIAYGVLETALKG